MPLEHEPLIWTPDPSDISRERIRIAQEISDIGLPTLETIAKLASDARRIAYTPYSHYQVGAAILTLGSDIKSGQNIEVVSYSESGHAEEQAIKNAVSAGTVQQEGRAFLRAIAVAHEGDTAPCGRCRQIIAEFGNNPLVIVADPEGTIRSVTSLAILLPYAFTPKDLGIA